MNNTDDGAGGGDGWGRGVIRYGCGLCYYPCSGKGQVVVCAVLHILVMVQELCNDPCSGNCPVLVFVVLQILERVQGRY